MEPRKKRHVARPVKANHSIARPVKPRFGVARPVNIDDIPPEVLKKYTSDKPLRWIRQFPIKPSPDEGPVDPNGTK